MKSYQEIWDKGWEVIQNNKPKGPTSKLAKKISRDKNLEVGCWEDFLTPIELVITNDASDEFDKKINALNLFEGHPETEVTRMKEHLNMMYMTFYYYIDCPMDITTEHRSFVKELYTHKKDTIEASITTSEILEIKSHQEKERSLEEKILDVLFGASFEKWYESSFMDYVEGTEDAKSKEDILKDVKRLFDIK